jgi:hypothetical protein
VAASGADVGEDEGEDEVNPFKQIAKGDVVIV